jgi:hypothetical protein
MKELLISAFGFALSYDPSLRSANDEADERFTRCVGAATN